MDTEGEVYMAKIVKCINNVHFVIVQSKKELNKEVTTTSKCVKVTNDRAEFENFQNHVH